MVIGCARVSTQGQNPVLQNGPLQPAGCERIFTECLHRWMPQRKVVEHPVQQWEEAVWLLIALIPVTTYWSLNVRLHQLYR